MTIHQKQTEIVNDSEDLSLRNDPSIIIPIAIPIYSATEPQPIEPTNDVAEHEEASTSFSNEITSIPSQPHDVGDGVVVFETPVSYDWITVFCVIGLPILALIVLSLLTGGDWYLFPAVLIGFVFVDLFLPHRLKVLAVGTLQITTFGSCNFSFSDLSNAYLASDHVGGSITCDPQYIGWDTTRIGRVIVKRGACKRPLIVSPQNSHGFINAVNQVASPHLRNG